MSSTPYSSQDRKCSAALQGNDQANLECVLDLQSKEDQADAAFVNDLDNSTCRSPSQQSAIDTLRHLEDDKILGLLSIIRLRHHVLYPYSDGLSKEQIDALSHLKLCSDSLIRLWLRHSRGWKQPLSRHIFGLTLIHSVSGGKSYRELSCQRSSHTTACCGQRLKRCTTASTEYNS